MTRESGIILLTTSVFFFAGLLIGQYSGFAKGEISRIDKMNQGGMTCEIRTDSAFPKVGVK